MGQEQPPQPQRQASTEALEDASSPLVEKQQKAALIPGQRRPDGKRQPPPPAPKGIGPPVPILKQLMAGPKYDAPARLNTRAQCEKELEHIVNWMKVGIPDPRDKRNKRRIFLDPNRGNAIVNAIRVSLQSKKDTEDLDLKRGDRELVRRVQDLERQLAELEDYAFKKVMPPSNSLERALNGPPNEVLSAR
jgi:hypothetical protein